LKLSIRFLQLLPSAQSGDGYLFSPKLFTFYIKIAGKNGTTETHLQKLFGHRRFRIFYDRDARGPKTTGET